jgi:hypothetical protein
VPGFHTLTDTFDDGVINTTLWSQNYGALIEADGRIKVPCTTGYAGLRSASIYTLTASHFFLRVYPPAAGGGTSAAANIFIQTTTGGTDAGFIVDAAGNAVGLYLRSGYADPAAVFLTYNPVDHAWLRIRETAGSIHWDTSPDGIAWTTRRTATAPAWASATTLSVVIEGHRDAGTPDYVQADNVNTPPITTVTGTAALTATSSLTATGTRTTLAAAPLTTSAALTAAAVRTARADSPLTAATSLTATAVRTATAAAALTGDTTLTVTGLRTAHTTAALTLTSDLYADATRTTRAATALTTTATLTAAGTVIQPVDVDITLGKPYSRWEVGTPWT